MRTERIPMRWPLMLAAAVTSTSLFAQAVAAAPAPVAAPATDAMPMEVNYVLLALAIVQMIFIVSLAGVMRTLIGPSAAWMKRMGGGGRAAVLIPLLLWSGGSLHAQAYASDQGTFSSKALFWWLVGINIFLFIILLLQVGLLRTMTGALSTVASEAAGAPVVDEGPTWVQRVMKRLTRQVEVEREQDVLMHHDYDGIRELDNVLPPWWVWLFYGSIAWAVVYLVNVHVINIWPDQRTAYIQEMDQARADVAAYMATLTDLVDENNVTAGTDAAIIAGGKAIFDQYCVACHMANGEGNVGPNLTDAYWIHGGGIKNVFKTIKYGVPEKGMISWQSQLKPSEIQGVASYILTLQGTNPPNAKAPQGDLWKDEAAPADSTAAPVDSLATPADTARLATR